MSNRTITLSLENIDEYIGHQDFSIDYCTRSRDRAIHQVTRDYWQSGVDNYTASRDRLVKIKEYLQKEEIEVLPTSFRARPIEDTSDELPAHTQKSEQERLERRIRTTETLIRKMTKLRDSEDRPHVIESDNKTIAQYQHDLEYFQRQLRWLLAKFQADQDPTEILPTSFNKTRPIEQDESQTFHRSTHQKREPREGDLPRSSLR